MEFFSRSRVKIIFSAARPSKASDFPPFLTSLLEPIQWEDKGPARGWELLCAWPLGVLYFSYKDYLNLTVANK